MGVKNRGIADKRLKIKTNPSSGDGCYKAPFRAASRVHRQASARPCERTGAFLDRAAVVIFLESHAAGFARMAAIAPPQNHGPWTMQGEMT